MPEQVIKGDLIMSERLSQLLESMTAHERTEVETFAAFVLARRGVQKSQIVTDDISTQELMRLVMESGSFDWLSAEEEDVYSIEDGEAVQWPSAS
jgi:hypothetical protein